MQIQLCSETISILRRFVGGSLEDRFKNMVQKTPEIERFQTGSKKKWSRKRGLTHILEVTLTEDDREKLSSLGIRRPSDSARYLIRAAYRQCSEEYRKFNN